MFDTANSARVLIMGVGNTLQQDDGIGIHVAESLRAQHEDQPNLDIIDGGTIGLSLLPQIEDADAVIIVDASELGEAPGTIRIFRKCTFNVCPYCPEINFTVIHENPVVLIHGNQDRSGAVIGLGVIAAAPENRQSSQ